MNKRQAEQKERDDEEDAKAAKKRKKRAAKSSSGKEPACTFDKAGGTDDFTRGREGPAKAKTRKVKCAGPCKRCTAAGFSAEAGTHHSARELKCRFNAKNQKTAAKAAAESMAESAEDDAGQQDDGAHGGDLFDQLLAEYEEHANFDGDELADIYEDDE